VEEYFTQERQQRIDLMLHLIPNTKQVILLRGPEQSGKSFFIRQFEIQADKNWKMATVSAESLNDSVPQLQVFAGAFNEGEENEKQIEVRLQSWSKAEKKAIICVEDAHLLSADTFNIIFQLSQAYECLHVILTSSDNLGDEIESSCQLIDIEPFTQKQTSEYAKYKVNNGGLDFSNVAGIDDVVLFIETGGLPGRINDVLRQKVHEPIVSKEKPTRSVRTYWVGGLAVLVIIVFVVNLFDNSDDIASNEATNEQELVIEKAMVAEKKVIEAPKVMVSKVKAPALEDKPSVKEVLEIKKEGQELLIESKEVGEKPLIKKADKIKVVENEEEVVVKPIVEIKQALKEPENSLEVVKADIPKLLTPLQKNHERINKINANNYTLQLIGVSTEKAANAYVLKRANSSAFIFFQNKRNNGNWYSVIYGDFKDKNTAMEAAKKLPASVGKLKPWVRSFESIQGDLYVK
jgi:DamX protein